MYAFLSAVLKTTIPNALLEKLENPCTKKKS